MCERPTKQACCCFDNATNFIGSKYKLFDAPLSRKQKIVLSDALTTRFSAPVDILKKNYSLEEHFLN